MKRPEPPTARHTCGRRAEMGMDDALSPFKGAGQNLDWYETTDDTCSYCGSLNPVTFLARCAAGDVELIPTDKDYKVYVRNDKGVAFKQMYRQCPLTHGPDECDHWVVREMQETKFYFQHLNKEQQAQFIDLYNQKKLKLGMPGYFYTMPFFAKPAPPKDEFH